MYPTTMTKKCIVPNCQNNRYSYPRMPLFSLPTNERRRALWLRLCQIREDDLGANPAVCSNHFESKFVVDHGLRHNLQYNAIPTLNLPSTKRTFSKRKTDPLPYDDPIHEIPPPPSMLGDHAQYHVTRPKLRSRSVARDQQAYNGLQYRFGPRNFSVNQDHHLGIRNAISASPDQLEIWNSTLVNEDHHAPDHLGSEVTLTTQYQHRAPFYFGTKTNSVIQDDHQDLLAQYPRRIGPKMVINSATWQAPVDRRFEPKTTSFRPNDQQMTTGGHLGQTDPHKVYCKTRPIVQLGYVENEKMGPFGRDNNRWRLNALRTNMSKVTALLNNEYRCDYCMAVFVSQKALSTHQLRVHYKDDGQVRYYCSMCTTIKVIYFADEQDFRAHMILSHQVKFGNKEEEPKYNLDEKTLNELRFRLIQTEKKNLPLLVREEMDGEEYDQPLVPESSEQISIKQESDYLDDVGVYFSNHQGTSTSINPQHSTVFQEQIHYDFVPVKSEDVDSEPLEIFTTYDESYAYRLPVKIEQPDPDANSDPSTSGAYSSEEPSEQNGLAWIVKPEETV